MTAQADSNFLERYRFKESKKAQLIETFQRIRFSGQLVWIAPNNAKQWSFFFCMGRLVYATGGTHPVRRWLRNLAVHCPQIHVDIIEMQQELCATNPSCFTSNWEYQLLCLWIEQYKITPEQVKKVLESTLEEVLFDLSKQDGLTYQIQEGNFISQQLALIDEQQVIAKVQQLWQALWQAKITGYPLDKAPIIKQPQKLQQYTPVKVYQVLTQLLDGENTLSDLAVKMKRDVVQVTCLLLPYIKSGLVELINIPDLSAPSCRRVPDVPSAQANSSKSLIACVDDSISVCHTLEKLITAAGYRFFGINDGLRALTLLLARKPDLIFLDLVMPYTNGYEICSNLRKAPSFRNTPIIILTGNDGIVDQVRARLVGASDFISKPVDAGKVLSTISKHLPQKTISLDRGAI
ncbi:MAG TPA: response regulator [Cyanobacteria bacterium UBA8553]|nr:response regulator [Cyanobacteria bacterium UBA8553]HAJ58434.1 response regulator [Cyanobacteria bacterium UBA8543]